MAIGTREEILSQIVSILEGISGAPPVFRNRGDIENISRPAIILLDGTERNMSTEQETGSTVNMRPAVILMSPQFFYLAKERDNASNDTVGNAFDPVGAELNAWLDIIRGALANDTALLELLTQNGQVIYRGCWTDLQTGSTLIGEMRVFIDFIYVYLTPASALT